MIALESTADGAMLRLAWERRHNLPVAGDAA